MRPTLGLVILAPVFFVVALAIKLDSRGPVFFRQVRMGAENRTFRVYKFRTMVADAEHLKSDIVHLNMHNGSDARMFKVPEDPRVTRVGTFLRRWRIDELPQLLNVVSGRMSLVGPRPLILEEDQHVSSWARRRLDLKPGMTGLWQVLGASDIPVRGDDEARLSLRHELVAARGSAAHHADSPRADPRPRRVLTPHTLGGDNQAVIFRETKLAGAFVIELERREDDRGFFARTFCQHEFEAHGLKPVIAQANLAFNKRRGTLRGMHFQYPPAAETKLVRCTRGAILDIIVDLRPESPTYLEHVSVELSADNASALYVPERFAHGYQVLEDETETSYQVGEFYTPDAEGGLRFDDPGARA